jgi:hypothetical protein
MEPATFVEAEANQAWRLAMKEEIDSIWENWTWELIELPPGHRVIGLKWVYNIKKDETGAVIKYKARLVAKGCLQQAEVDFEVFAPVARMESIRLVLTLVVDEGLAVHHMDMKTTFLNGELAEEVYVQQPQVFAGEEGKVLRLRRALYGLHQASRTWYEKLDGTLRRLRFRQSEHEHAIYCRSKNGGDRLIVGVYVDDLIITGTTADEIARFKEEMKQQIKMVDLGLLTFYLGLEVQQSSSSIGLCQAHYVVRILEAAGMDYNSTQTPMEEWLKLS